MHLVACKSCDRQYDCSHLDPGSRVHCACDALFLVPPPRSVGARALLCSNCGGPVGPGDEACPYCAAAVSERDRRESTLCPHCWARISAEARHCAGCGVRIQPQALTPLPNRDCPRCGAALHHRGLGETSVVECGDCGGLWLERATFHDLCHKAAVAPALPRPVDGRGEVPEERNLRYLSCPLCAELMARQQFRFQERHSGIVIDVCRRHGLWLDGGELEAIGRFIRTARAPGIDWDVPTPMRIRATAEEAGGGSSEPRGLRGWAALTGEALVDMLEWLANGLGTRWD